MIFTPSMDLPTDSTLSTTGSGPAEVMTLAICSPWFLANDHSL